MQGKSMVEGKVLPSILIFALPLFLSNLLQQFYNIADTLIVSNFIGKDALAAVGSSFTLMILITSIIFGLCLGASSLFSIKFGEGNIVGLKRIVHSSFVLIAIITLILVLMVYFNIDAILRFMNVGGIVFRMMKDYLLIIFLGIPALFLYNFSASIYRSFGNSKIPMIYLAISVFINIVLDYIFVVIFKTGVRGAAIATILAQYMSAVAIFLNCYISYRNLRFHKKEKTINLSSMKLVGKYSILTCLQQSIMNFGIFMVQGLVNSFGTNVMAAFASGVKVDSFAYMPVQDFGNAFSIFVAQNFGANKKERIRKGLRVSLIVSFIFSLMVSILVVIFSKELISIFITDENIIEIGARYLTIEGSFYFLIGWLFILYGYYRSVALPQMSIVLTVISLGIRVLLAYISAYTPLGLVGIWISIPIGWFLADSFGFMYYLLKKRTIKAK